ncbi:MAG: VanZ family protein [Candidatus Contendobacter sp.]
MLLFPWIPPVVARLALLLAILAITTLALMPVSTVPITTWWDKLDHGLAFITLALLADHAFPRQSFWRRLAPWLLAYGVAIELAQWLTPDRDLSVLDVLADGIGIVSYGVLRRLAIFFYRLEPSG